MLDVKSLTQEQLDALSDGYDRLCEESLLPLPEMGNDQVRAEIDAYVANTLGLPDVTFLRELLAREPVVSLRRLN